MSVSDYSLAPSSNTSISGINIGEGCPPANINDAIRQLMADVKEMRDQVAQGMGDFRHMVPVGGAVRWYSDTIPADYAPPDGRALSRTSYAALFALWGTRYGAGDGSTTFNMPDERGRAAVQAGAGPSLSNRALGWSGGAETHQLTVDQLPVHNHPVNITTSHSGEHQHRQGSEALYNDFGGGAHVGNRNYPATSVNQSYRNQNTSIDGGHSHSVSGNTDNRGAGQAHNNMQPSFAAHWIIRLR